MFCRCPATQAENPERISDEAGPAIRFGSSGATRERTRSEVMALRPLYLAGADHLLGDQVAQGAAAAQLLGHQQRVVLDAVPHGARRETQADQPHHASACAWHITSAKR